ncbi:methyltransferase type 11 [Grosmannia clavigera kw1407]|uniref:Methyltransferase type 11 n=1 Tax=Grosmannia clavigera (strain kw1407 / UAMH 11150) TaxID=655863 RepID=F0XD37_GROCL|nr:methyltransferase type 11 [Grosmannia clavigera kw1407]EFX03548.1 methyltransferase type 11 [Grosmannia clavigera kw1407]
MTPTSARLSTHWDVLPAAATGRRARRGYASQAGGKPVFEVFSRRAKWLQKERAAADVETSRQTDYLKDEVAFRLCERLLDIKRTFPRALDFGANSCNIARALVRPNPDPDPAQPTSPALATHIGHLTAAESSPTLLFRDVELPFNKALSMSRHVMSVEEEEAAGANISVSDTSGIPGAENAATAPFVPGSYDLVLSSLSLHWINDLPGALTQINRLLRPDCPFLGAMLGGDSLFELRTSLQLAEQERRGGLSPHVSPLADVRDVGGLMQRAGFNMLTVDVEDIVVDYPDSFALMADLQAMGESSAILGREMGPIGRDVLLAGDAIYRALHGNPDGSIPATFRIIYMIGWHPSDNQPKPLARGSGQVNLKDILEQK